MNSTPTWGGRKVVVTTRDQNIVKIMGAKDTCPLETLSDEHCWSLFEKHAFENGDSRPYPHLREIGEDIVVKCQKLPLALKALGSLLHSKTDRKDWVKVLESEIWSLRKCEILPWLILSYQDLPLHLKRCFA